MINTWLVIWSIHNDTYTYCTKTVWKQGQLCRSLSTRQGCERVLMCINQRHYIYMHTGQGCDYLITMPYTQTVGDR